jgi:hypothetical protein
MIANEPVQMMAASSSRPIHPVSRLPLSSKHSITALQKTILADLQPWFSKSEPWINVAC